MRAGLVNLERVWVHLVVFVTPFESVFPAAPHAWRGRRNEAGAVVGSSQRLEVCHRSAGAASVPGGQGSASSLDGGDRHAGVRLAGLQGHGFLSHGELQGRGHAFRKLINLKLF